MISARPRLLIAYKLAQTRHSKQMCDVLKYCNGKNNVAYITYLVSQDYQANVHHSSVCEILHKENEKDLVTLFSENE